MAANQKVADAVQLSGKVIVDLSLRIDNTTASLYPSRKSQTKPIFWRSTRQSKLRAPG
jgi:hypothetical protein